MKEITGKSKILFILAIGCFGVALYSGFQGQNVVGSFLAPVFGVVGLLSLLAGFVLARRRVVGVFPQGISTKGDALLLIVGLTPMVMVITIIWYFVGMGRGLSQVT